MTSLTRWITWLANLGVGLSGGVLIWMLWWVTPEDPYAIINHPAQPLWKNLHLWTSPLLVLNIGFLWSQHAWAYWRGKVQSGRRSGILLLLTALPMILSGPLLQTALSEASRNFWSLFHIFSSLLWLLTLLIHIGIHRIQILRTSS